MKSWEIIHWTIKVPVICPVCGAESLIELNGAQTLGALETNRPLYLHAFCHSACWNASEFEVEQIRKYVRSVD